MSDDDSIIESPPFIQRSLKARKGRGAVSNLQGRYEVLAREAVDDGWSQAELEHPLGYPGHADNAENGPEGIEVTRESAGRQEDAQPVPTLKTEVIKERAKSILTRNQSPDVPFSISINPYRGCEHGCIYCFARPTHSYLGLSPGLDFESRIYAKINAPELLRQELAKKSYIPEPIALGVNTDAYQPCERELRLTRRLLEVLSECQHPVALITKSSLIERDIDLLRDMAAKRLVAAAVTITTLDHSVSRTLEPRAAAPARRLRVIRTLSEAGVPVGVSVAPIIPFVTEPELEKVLAAAAEAGAINASYVVLRLPWEVSPLFRQWLEAHFPERAQRVMNRVREMRGGKDYDASFGKRMHGEGVWADMIRQRFEKCVARIGLGVRSGRFSSLDTSRFRPPSLPSLPFRPPDARGRGKSAKAPAASASSAKSQPQESRKPDGQLKLF